MVYVYRLTTKPHANIPVPVGTPSITIDNAEVNWETDEQGRLDTVFIIVSNQPYIFDDRGVLLSSYPELETLTFRLSTYIANRLLMQTGVDAVDPEMVLLTSPELRAETAAEQTILSNRSRAIEHSIRIGYAIQARFEPNSYPNNYNHSAALALFADGLRVVSPFQKYELFYKVIEYFFAEDGPALDTAASNHILPFDPRFVTSQIEVLRVLRNRVIHPRARRGHVNPQNLEALQEVRTNLVLIHDLARLLLHHPTF